MYRYLFCIFLINCTNDPNKVGEFIVKEEFPIEEIQEAELLHTENGDLKVKIFANKIKRFKYKNPSLIFSDKIIVSFYNDSAELSSILTADNASIDEHNRIMIASDDVVLDGQDYKKLETEELIWDEKANKIYTNKKVKITTNKEVIFGEGFHSTPDFKQYSISNIQGTVNFDLQESQ